MSTGYITIILVIAIIILIISLVYASIASTAIRQITDYSSDSNLDTAYKYLVWASVVGWIAAIGIIVGIIVLFTEGEELFFTGAGSTILALILFVTVVLLIAVGVLSAISATNIAKSPKYTGNDTNAAKAYKDSVISASTALGSLGLVVIVALIYYSTRSSYGQYPDPYEQNRAYPGQYGSRNRAYPGQYRSYPGQYGSRYRPYPGQYQRYPTRSGPHIGAQFAAEGSFNAGL